MTFLHRGAPDLRHEPKHRTPRMTAAMVALRLQHLLLRGFSEAAADKIFEAVDLPPVADIDAKISALRDLGFADPVKMITSSPAILGLSVDDNIKPKISALRDLGFADPVKMITSSPAILGYAPDRLRLVGKIIAGLDDREDAMFGRLISKRRSVLDHVAGEGCHTWAEVRAVLAILRKGAA